MTEVDGNSHRNPQPVTQKKPPIYKPDPVIVCHLSSLIVTNEVYLFTPFGCLGASQRQLGTQPFFRSTSREKTKMYITFQPTRFIHPPNYLEASCALTARFHPYSDKSERLFSATLSVTDVSVPIR